jgi:hypothetical protein
VISPYIEVHVDTSKIPGVSDFIKMMETVAGFTENHETTYKSETDLRNWFYKNDFLEDESDDIKPRIEKYSLKCSQIMPAKYNNVIYNHVSVNVGGHELCLHYDVDQEQLYCYRTVKNYTVSPANCARWLVSWSNKKPVDNIAYIEFVINAENLIGKPSK